MALITLLDAQLAFGHVALLDHADFSLESSERIGLIGRNGAGKSSLLKILGGLSKPDDGSMQVQQGLRIAYVAQEPQLDAQATIFQAACVGLETAIALREQYLSGASGLDLDDLDSITWLEDLLLAFKGSVVTITHDRAFLDRIATRIVELDRGQLRSYPGNFAQYQLQKEEQLAQEAVINARADKLLAQEEVWIRKGVEARRTRSQSRISRLEQLRANRSARRDALGSVKMDVASGAGSSYQGKVVAQLTGIHKAFGDKPIVRDFTATILRGDKVGLIGPNGAGKTTLLKMILGQLPPDSGDIRQGSNLQIAYFDQMRHAIDLDATLEDFISPGSEWIEIGNQRKHVKSYLGDFLFSPARAHSPVRSLSGGERNRLLLARLFARPANVLVLDEPTNDLDIDTLELLEELLQTYDGTVFLVSHDRSFLDNVVTSTIAWEGEGLWREYEGGVQDWLTQMQRSRALAAAAMPQNNKKIEPKAAPAKREQLSKKKLSYKEQRELEQLPAQIAALEAEQHTIRATLEDGTLYTTDGQRAAALLQRDADIDELLMQALERWTELSDGS